MLPEEHVPCHWNQPYLDKTRRLAKSHCPVLLITWYYQSNVLCSQMFLLTFPASTGPPVRISKLRKPLC
jgi:hypothetical protein